MKKIIVIGAGPSGMMAAGRAAELGADVLLLEKNKKVGRKLAITGKGRCNLTNFCDNDEFIAHLTANPRFLYSAIHYFSCYDTIAFFEDLGLKTKVERGNRVFPESDKALDVVDKMYVYATDSGAEIRNAAVRSLIVKDGAVKGVRLADREILCDKVIIASGGLSYPKTGSTGDGYRLAKSAGHTVTPILPSLVPLESNDDFCRELQGLSLKNVSLKVIDNFSGKEIYSDFGEMLFTHFGVSGPMILSASAHMRNMSPDRYQICIDLKPALDYETLEKRLLRDLAKFSNKDIINSLSELLPRKLIPVILKKADVNEHVKCNALSVENRLALVEQMKRFSVSIHSFCPIDEAVVTSGGVNVREIDPRTMESKLTKNLFFCGEVMDVDAYTGGFNLQIAFCTGRLAGESAALL